MSIYVCVCVCVCEYIHIHRYMDLSGSISGKETTYNAGATGDAGSIPGSERSPEGRHGTLLHYSCLENSIDKGDWWGPWGLKE